MGRPHTPKCLGRDLCNVDNAARRRRASEVVDSTTRCGQSNQSTRTIVFTQGVPPVIVCSRVYRKRTSEFAFEVSKRHWVKLPHFASGCLAARAFRVLVASHQLRVTPNMHATWQLGNTLRVRLRVNLHRVHAGPFRESASLDSPADCWVSVLVRPPWHVYEPDPF